MYLHTVTGPFKFFAHERSYKVLLLSTVDNKDNTYLFMNKCKRLVSNLHVCH